MKKRYQLKNHFKIIFTWVEFNSMIKYSEVFSNKVFANLLRFGSWGSRGSKLLVLVDRVGPEIYITKN